MSWNGTPSEHAKIWSSAVAKIMARLDRKDLEIAGNIFSEQHKLFLDKLPDQRYAVPMFVDWVISCFMKEGMPLPLWFISNNGKAFSSDEIEVLVAGSESYFGAFKIKSFSGNLLVLADTGGREFSIETVGLPKAKAGTKVLGRIFSKGRGRWFVPGQLGVIGNDEFAKMSASRRFRDSWHSLLKGFFTYLAKEQHLSEKTADSHAENTHLLTMFLEHDLEVDSFSKVTKTMLKTGLKEFSRKHISPRPDMDKVYYSLFKFFDYLEWEKGIKNPEAMDWLKARI